jgi:hypothetical protein
MREVEWANQINSPDVIACLLSPLAARWAGDCPSQSTFLHVVRGKLSLCWLAGSPNRSLVRTLLALPHSPPVDHGSWHG